MHALSILRQIDRKPAWCSMLCGIQLHQRTCNMSCAAKRWAHGPCMSIQVWHLHPGQGLFWGQSFNQAQNPHLDIIDALLLSMIPATKKALQLMLMCLYAYQAYMPSTHCCLHNGGNQTTCSDVDRAANVCPLPCGPLWPCACRPESSSCAWLVLTWHLAVKGQALRLLLVCVFACQAYIWNKSLFKAMLPKVKIKLQAVLLQGHASLNQEL